MRWEEKAACSEHPNPDLWWPEDMTEPGVAEALEICAGCPVLEQCREFALYEFPLPDGLCIIGGFTARKLINERKKRGIKPPPKLGLPNDLIPRMGRPKKSQIDS